MCENHILYTYDGSVSFHCCLNGHDGTTCGGGVSHTPLFIVRITRRGEEKTSQAFGDHLPDVLLALFLVEVRALCLVLLEENAPGRTMPSLGEDLEELKRLY
jgi:hypothetical protein